VRRLGTLAIVVSAALALAACTSTPTLTSSLSCPGGSSSGFSFADSQVNYPYLPQGRTPEIAVTTFIARGSVSVPGTPKVSPLFEGFPRSGWHEVVRASKTVTFDSAESTLRVTKVPAGSWAVVSGQACKP
jgi:hypothetical protein